MTIIHDNFNSKITGNQGERSVGHKELSKDDFITIFLAQMKMQDPMKPYDSSAMLQQMSQLTSLSASEELQKVIHSLNYNLGKSQVLSASQLIGKHVQVPSESTQLIKGEGLKGSVIVPAAVTGVDITIKNAKGEVVKVVKKGASGSGVVDFEWDGKNDKGEDMPEDVYQISASATIDGKETKLITAGTFRVQSVAMDPRSGNLILNLDGRGGTDMSEIIKII